MAVDSLPSPISVIRYKLLGVRPGGPEHDRRICAGIELVVVEQSPSSSTDRIADDVLIADAIANNAEAYEALIRRHHRMLLQLARLYVPSDASAAAMPPPPSIRNFARCFPPRSRPSAQPNGK